MQTTLFECRCASAAAFLFLPYTPQRADRRFAVPGEQSPSGSAGCSPAEPTAVAGRVWLQWGHDALHRGDLSRQGQPVQERWQGCKEDSRRDEGLCRNR